MDPREIFKKVHQTPDKKELAFALQIGLGVIKGAIWGIEAGRAKVFSLGETINWQQESQLVEAADQTFSSACEQAAVLEEEEPKRVIFGLPYSWVEGEKILPEKLRVLKKICQDLDLKPVGFVVTTEAIVKYLKTLEGVSPNAILINLAKQNCEIALLRLGKIVGTAIVTRSNDLGEDVAEGLSRIEAEEVLPARMIFYDSSQEIEEKKEEVLRYPWLDEKQGFNFLHLPKVEVVSPDFDIKAVALAGGAEVTKAKGVEVEIPLEEEPELKEEIETKEEKPGIIPEKGITPTKTPPKLEFGFVSEKDVASQEKPEVEFPKVEEKEPEVIPFKAEMPETAVTPTQEEKEITPKKVSLIKRLPIPHLHFNFSHFLAPFRKVFSWFAWPAKLPLIGLFLGGLLLLIAIGLFCLWWFYPKATVILYIAPQTQEKEFQITLDSEATNSDPVAMVIPARLIEKTIQGEEEKATTGTKIIGDKARGGVVIYNRTAENKTLTQATILTGPQGLKFSLDEPVTVASESAGSDYTLVPGKATVSVTALEIGSEGNLAAGTEFEVDKYSKTDLVSRNDAAFGGGTSREIRVVSEEDQENLTTSLLEKLRNQAKQQLAENVSSEDVLLPESLTEKIEEKSFDHDLKEEAETLKLKMQVNFKALAYQRLELNRLAEEKFKNSVPSGFEFKAEESEVSFKLSKIINEKKALFSAVYKATLWPKINTQQIRDGLKGKKPEIVNFYLAGLPNLSGFNVSFNKPTFPSRIRTFPHVLKNIQIEIKSK